MIGSGRAARRRWQRILFALAVVALVATKAQAAEEQKCPPKLRIPEGWSDEQIRGIFDALGKRGCGPYIRQSQDSKDSVRWPPPVSRRNYLGDWWLPGEYEREMERRKKVAPRKRGP